uniref:Uncharacterized protein n=1 Tax=Arundo donax TaxID=35708 RepID=A0A0A8YJI7_ARUDO
MLSMIPPREVQMSELPRRRKNRYMYTGLYAFNTELSYLCMLTAPTLPIKMNQRRTIGAKSHPTLSVP